MAERGKRNVKAGMDRKMSGLDAPENSEYSFGPDWSGAIIRLSKKQN